MPRLIKNSYSEKRYKYRQFCVFDCPALDSIYVSLNNTVYRSSGNCLIEKESGLLVAGCNTSVIPDDGSVVGISDGAFAGSGIESVNIPEGVTSIGELAFQSCGNLTEVSIPAGVTRIENGTFESCSALSSITVPDSVTVIENSAFENCDSLSTVYYTGTEEQWNAINTGDGNESLLSADILFGEGSLTINYYIEDTTTPVADAYTTSDLVYGDSFSIESPHVTGFHLVDEEQSTVTGTKGFGSTEINVYYALNYHTVTWIIDGKVYQTNTLAFGEFISVPNIGEREGYTFSGWSPSVAGTVGDMDYTYNATWIANTYTITYYVDGEQYDEKSYSFGEEVTKLETPSKPGCIFLGWDIAEPATMPAENLVLHGSFAPSQKIVLTAKMNTESSVSYENKASNYYPLRLERTPVYKFTSYAWVEGLPEDVSIYDNVVFHWYFDSRYLGTSGKSDYCDYNGQTAVSYSFSVDYDEIYDWNGYLYAVISFHDTIYEDLNNLQIFTNHTLLSVQGQPVYAECARVAGTPITTDDGSEYILEARPENLTDESQFDYYLSPEETPENYYYVVRFFSDESYDINSRIWVAHENDWHYRGFLGVNHSIGGEYYRSLDYIKEGNGEGELSNNGGGSDAYAWNYEVNGRGYNKITFDGGNGEKDDEKIGTPNWSDKYPNRTQFSTQKLCAETVPNYGTATFDGRETEKYSINYTVNGEIWFTQLYEVGETVTAPEVPELEGYTSHGWDAVLPETMPAEDITVNAVLTANTYTITYLLDGVEYPAPYESAVDTYEYDSPVEVRPDAVKEGCSVSAWSFSPSLRSGRMPAGDVTATATSKVNSYELSVNYVMADGKTELAPETYYGTVEYATEYSVASPAVTGYTPDISTATGTMGPDDKTVTVTYSPNDYSLTVNYTMSDGENGFAPAAHTGQVTYNTDYRVDSPAVPGYTPDRAVVSGTMDSEGKTEEVVYSPVDCTLTINYVMQDGSAPPPQNISAVKYNAAYSVVSPAVDGYTPSVATVGGKMDDVNGKTIEVVYSADFKDLIINYVYEDGSPVTDINPNPYIGGVSYNGSFSVPSPAVTGYTPDSEEISGTMNSTDGLEYTVTYSVNRYALNITYVMSDGNDAVRPQNIVDEMLAFGTPYSVASPAVTGYTPDVATVEGTMGVDGASAVVTYNPNPHKVTWIIDGGVYQTDDVVFGGKITTPGLDDKEGYTFSGWSPAVAETVADEDYTYTASWSINSYTITYLLDGAEYETVVDTYEYNSTVTVRKVEIKGYDVSAWTFKPALVNGRMPAGNVVAKATATVNQYTITFRYGNVKGNEIYRTITQNYGTSINKKAVAAPNYPCWVFTGWSEDIPSKMPAENMTITAQWTKKVFDYSCRFGFDNSAVSFFGSEHKFVDILPFVPLLVLGDGLCDTCGKTHTYNNSSFSDINKLKNYVKKLDKTNCNSTITAINSYANKPWTGSCYGMSVASIMDFREQLSFNERYKKPDLSSVNTPYSDSSVASEINYYQLAQKIPCIDNTEYKQSAEADWYETLNKLVAAAQKGDPFLFKYTYDGFDNSGKKTTLGHSIVALGCQANGNKIYRISAYDNRFHDKDVWIDVDLTTPSRATCSVVLPEKNGKEVATGIQFIADMDVFNLIDYDGNNNTSASYSNTNIFVELTAFGNTVFTNSSGQTIIYSDGNISGTMDIISTRIITGDDA
ncbi:MAG: leucine-rich repeat protein, partial [Clostridia bacterium]|nr:leucine-rich repeat protein [Clostridia bacterium]